MPRSVDAFFASSRERARRAVGELVALRDLATDIGRYAARRLRARYGKAHAADPVDALFAQLVLDAERTLLEAKKTVACAIADEHRLARRAKQEQADAEDWAGREALAEQAGDAALARSARGRQQEHVAAAGDAEDLWVRQKTDVEALKGLLRTVNERIEQTKRDRERAVVTQRTAHAQEDVRQTMRRMEETVTILERMAATAVRLEEAECRPAHPHTDTDRERTTDDDRGR
jgi:phage shock protein A